MKIDSYAVNAKSEREYMKVESATTLLTKVPVKLEPQPKQGEEQTLKLELSENAKQAITQQQEKAPTDLERLRARLTEIRNSRIATDPMELKLRLLEQMMSALSKKRYRGHSIRSAPGLRSQYYQQSASFSQSQSLQIQSGVQLGTGLQSGRTAQGMQTEYFSYERESVNYQATGVINTADGKSISVDISMSMSREHAAYEYSEVQFKQLDPLVINYGGTAASLTGEKFAFDLDMDGKMDMISALGEGSGFLALDKNGDGKINDGSELFGPQSGNGFSDLRSYDSDGNGWIDENDNVWSELKIWSKDADGNDQLFTLLELDVGAIFLGDVNTEFSMNGDNNKNHGTMRSTSFFLKESGGAGLVHHIDMSL